MSEGLQRPAGTPRGPNCGVTACAIVAGCSFVEAWEAFCHAWRAQGKSIGNRKGWTTLKDRLRALRLLGVNVKLLEIESGLYSLEEWVEIEGQAGKTYLVDTKGHCQVVRDGMVQDQWTEKAIALRQHHHRLRAVMAVLEVVEDDVSKLLEELK